MTETAAPSTKLAGRVPEFLVDDFGFVYLKDIHRAQQELQSTQSDRAIAIIAMNIIDVLLEATLKEKFRDDKALLSELFRDEGGALSSTRMKANLCYLLKLIDGETYQCINALSKIRNRFSHKLHISSFQAQEIAVMLNGYSVTWDKLEVPKYGELPSEAEKFFYLWHKCCLILGEAGARAYIGRFDTGQIEELVDEHWKTWFEKRGEQYPLPHQAPESI